MVRDVAFVRLGFVYSVSVQQRGVEDMQMVDNHWYFQSYSLIQDEYGRYEKKRAVQINT